MLEEVAVVRHIYSEEGHVEVVAVVVQEAHKQPRRRQRCAHFQVPFVHISH